MRYTSTDSFFFHKNVTYNYGIVFRIKICLSTTIDHTVWCNINAHYVIDVTSVLALVDM